MSWHLIDGDVLLKVLLSFLNITIFWVLYRSLFSLRKKSSSETTTKHQKSILTPPTSQSSCCSTEVSSCCKAKVEVSSFSSTKNDYSSCCGTKEDFSSCCQQSSTPSDCCQSERPSLKILYASQTGTGKKLAQDLLVFLQDSFATGCTRMFDSLQLLNINDYDVDDLFTENAVCLFILSTYTDGGPSDDASWFFQWLEDTYFDFRVSRDAFHRLKFAILGLGHSDYGKNFSKMARVVQHRLEKLSALSLLPLQVADAKYDQLEHFTQWRELLSALFTQIHSGTETWQQAAVKPEAYYESDEDDTSNQSTATADKEEGGDVDLEDLGKVAALLQDAKHQATKNPSAVTTRRPGAPKVSIAVGGSEAEEKTPAKEMVTPLLRAALSKQGYSLIGSHSGVKICRWTKAMLRGRGGCYKHTFYGIASHRCMETTPSLACANKCVFCWRHHTNPVGTEWRWKMDDASFVLEGAIENHLRMMKQLRGVPGVDAERFQEAQHVKHCALSLVGEPIMYPQINQFLDLLHRRGISSFLVTNAQFPDLITSLTPVTQLYVSVDAPTKDSLKAIDRPLFKDFWERFLDSLRALSAKRQRTVYRLTLVKKFNDDEIDDYAQLIMMGRPDFVEVKGVTFCGYSGANPLTMSNVPFHREVVAFCQVLCQRLAQRAAQLRTSQKVADPTADSSSRFSYDNSLSEKNYQNAQLPPTAEGEDEQMEYEIACEHEHSCSVLIANKKFWIDGAWHTWIDYEKFNQLVLSKQPFSSLDYVAPTPIWALTGAEEKGFDPKETRFFRNTAYKGAANFGQTEKIDHGC